MLLRHGLRGYGWHSKQLCKGRLEPLRLDGQHAPIARIPVVPHLQHPHKLADEQDWAQEHSTAEPCYDPCGNGDSGIHP